MPKQYLEEEQFFKMVGSSAGVEPDTARRIYNAMLRVVYAELRSKKVVRLPALCEINLIISRAKRIKNKHMDASIVKPPSSQVRITPLAAIRGYFQALDGRL